MFRSGYLTVAHLGGIPIRLHWSIPVAALVFGRFRFVPGFWIGFFCVVLLHELGHAYLVRRYRLNVEAVEIHGLGGVCRYSGYPSPIERSIIAWGGVLAQAMLLVATYVFLWTAGAPTSSFGADLVHAFTMGNLIIAGINLLPIPPLDGAEAWKLFGLLRAGRRQRHKDARRRRVAAARRAARDLDAGRDLEGDVDVIDLDEVNESVREALQNAAKEAARGRHRRENQG